jgi:hypothetical protein
VSYEDFQEWIGCSLGEPGHFDLEGPAGRLRGHDRKIAASASLVHRDKDFS